MFVILNKDLQIILPANCHYPTEEEAKKNPNKKSWDTRDEARAFAEFCAKKWRDNDFYVFESIGVVRTAEPPVRWTGDSQKR